MAGAERRARAPGSPPRCSGCRARTATSARCARAALDALDELGVADVAGRLPGEPALPASRSASRWPARWSPSRELLLLDEPAGGLGARRHATSSAS